MSASSGSGRGRNWIFWRRSATKPDRLPPKEAADTPAANVGQKSFDVLFGQGTPPCAAAVPPDETATELPDSAARASRSAKQAPGRAEILSDPDLAIARDRHNGTGFLTPDELSTTKLVPGRVALIGSCFLSAWNIHGRHATTSAFDVYTVNHGADLPDQQAASAYDLQIIQIPMRSFFQDGTISLLPYSDVAGHQAAFETACTKLGFLLEARMKWNIANGLLSFVANFPLPQRNMLGVLFPRFDIRNPEHFVHKLNEALEAMVRNYPNAYVLDVDRISASYGRRYMQDDIVASVTHNSILGLDPPNSSRMEPMGALHEHYDIAWPAFLADAIWSEAVSMYRVVKQADTVKMVIVDLDDTLWHGVSGEMADVGGHMLAGWPSGLAEALLYLKKRGVLLAIASKNDANRVAAIWPKIFRRSLKLEDFAITRIDWRPKAENIRDMLNVVNLLPRNVVFIDDNPAERAAVGSAFPEMRVLGRHPYYLRRILLWAAETQVPAISEESAGRTKMVQSQAIREDTKRSMSREAFLAAAAVQLELFWVVDLADARFPRVLELINKTNQFNTTGVRRSRAELGAFFAAGGRILAYEVTDAFTAYGLVGAVLLSGPVIEQWVMSCRVIGYDIEVGVMSALMKSLEASGQSEVTGLLVETDVNHPCRDLFAKCGFHCASDVWQATTQARPAMPASIQVMQAR